MKKFNRFGSANKEENIRKSPVISIQRDHKKTVIQAQCCKPGPCSPK